MAADRCRIILVRHGETEFNRQGRWQGSGSDPPLNAAGRDQAARLAEQLADRPIAALYTSPQLRARETAAIIGQSVDLDPIVVDDLREMSHGLWEGKDKQEIMASWSDEYAAFEADPLRVRRPGGDSYGDLAERVWPALDRLADRHQGETIAAVSHGGPVRLVLSEVLDRPLTERASFGVENGSLFTVERGADGYWRRAQNQQSD